MLDGLPDCLRLKILSVSVDTPFIAKTVTEIYMSDISRIYVPDLEH